MFPPTGWRIHPDNPLYYYKGQEVLTEAQLRATIPKIEFVYIMSRLNRSITKIGFSKHPKQRLKEIQPSCNQALIGEYIFPHPYAFEAEQRCHRVLSKYRVALEWFATNVKVAKEMVEDTLGVRALPFDSNDRRILPVFDRYGELIVTSVEAGLRSTSYNCRCSCGTELKLNYEILKTKIILGCEACTAQQLRNEARKARKPGARTLPRATPIGLLTAEFAVHKPQTLVEFERMLISTGVVRSRQDATALTRLFKAVITSTVKSNTTTVVEQELDEKRTIN